MTLPVFVQQESPRLLYAVDLVVRQMMGWSYQLVGEQPSPEDPHILITGHPAPSPFSWYDSGFLHQTGISTPKIMSPDDDQPGLCFDESGVADVLASVFWLVTEYAGWEATDLDEHGRWIETDVHSQLPLRTRPVVHDWVQVLETSLLSKWPQLKEVQHKRHFPHEVVIDIDQPWKYLQKPLWVQIGGWIKAILRGNMLQARERAATWKSGQDPNDTIDELLDICQPDTTKVFILFGGKHPNDSRFSSRHLAWRRKIEEIANRGFSVHIHPSYTSSDVAGQILKEKQMLDGITESGSDVRMHFLRYSLPQTRREMLKAGIKRDYSLYRKGEGGFPCGMMQPFPWYDLENEESTSLWIVPTMLMDRTVVGTALAPSGISAVEASEQALSMLKTAQAGNGSFVLCLHNECLSESEEWSGWSDWTRDIITTLNSFNGIGRS